MMHPVDDLAEDFRKQPTGLPSGKGRMKDDANITARYLKQVQDTAARTAIPDDPQQLDNAGPAYLRARAAHFRRLAEQQPDGRRVKLFRDLADSFETQARIRERGPAAKA
jgi:hypothetical protein